MDPTLRTVTNWISFYLEQGRTEDQIYELFQSKFASLPQDLFAEAFAAANRGYVNAGNFIGAHGNTRLYNLLDLPGGQYQTVQIRALLHLQSVQGRGKNQQIVKDDYATFQHDFGYGERVADVMAYFSSICRDKMSESGYNRCNITIIPGAYFPG